MSKHDEQPRPTVGSGATATDGGATDGAASPRAKGDEAYHFGHLAAERPEYRDREFEAIEADLQKGWTDEQRLHFGDWSLVRGFAREGWARRRGTMSASPGASLGNEPMRSDESALSSESAGGAGSWGEHLEGQPAGHVNPSVGANLGGSPSHQRPSFSDPVAAIADHVAGGVDPDGRVERVANRTDAEGGS